MRALITGSAGFIGSHLTELLLNEGWDVAGVDCFNDNYGREQKRRNLERALDWDSFTFYPLDLATGDLEDLVMGCDAIFHLAAEPGVRSSWGTRFEDYVRNNLLATQRLLEATKRYSQSRFVYASSSSIYGRAETLPTAENATPAPHSPYGVTKLAAEQLCRVYYENFGVSSVMLRYFTVYGPRQRPDMFFNKLVSAALAGNPVHVYGDGEQSRDFTYVADVAAVTRAAADSTSAIGNAYNIGGGERTTVNGAISMVESILDRKIDVIRQPNEYGDVRDTGALTDAARRDLGFDPQTGLQAGLVAECEWLAAAQAPSAA